MGIKKYKNKTVCEFLIQHNLQREGESAASGESTETTTAVSKGNKEQSFALVGESGMTERLKKPLHSRDTTGWLEVS